MSFNTNEQIKIRKRGRGAVEEEQNIPMLNRGDGVQMQFLSFLLWFIASKDKKHLYIWGFEEPEIAYEFKKQFDMADVFIKDFSKNAQIFLSTHSPAFVFLHGTDNIRQYRVHKEKDKVKNRIVSTISDIDRYVENLFESGNKQSKQLQQDIWGTNYQRMTNTLGHILRETDDYKQIEVQLQNVIDEVQLSKKKTEAKEKELNAIKNELKDLYPEKIFICEDAKGVAVWSQLFEKIDLNGIKILSSKGCSNDSIESAIKFKQLERKGYEPKIFRQLDLDGYLPEQVTFIENRIPIKHSQLRHYRLKFLPVNELENFAILAEPYFTDESIKQDSDKFDFIKDALVDTAKANLPKILKNYIDSTIGENDKKLFLSQESKMRDNAKTNIRELMPGKDICKLKNRFSAEKKLKSLSAENFPETLAEYLATIKTFFDND